MQKKVQQVTAVVVQTCKDIKALPKEKIKQASQKLLKEVFQLGYEYFHFLGGPLPKTIDCVQQKGLLSGTAIPKYSRGRRGRIALLPIDSYLGYMTYTKGLATCVSECKENLIKLLHIECPQHTDNIGFMFIVMLGCGIYYGIIKPADLQEAKAEVCEKNDQE